MVTIIFAHPAGNSYNHALLQAVTEALDTKPVKYAVIDLYRDKFNPVLSNDEWLIFNKGQYVDGLVGKYQDILKNTEELIFIFPVWWYDMPAILKGFMDKVLLKQFAYVGTNTGVKGLLTNIRKATAITTAVSAKWYLKYFCGNPIEGVFLKTTMKAIGIKRVKWLHSSDISRNDTVKRNKFIQRIKTNLL